MEAQAVVETNSSKRRRSLESILFTKTLIFLLCQKMKVIPLRDVASLLKDSDNFLDMKRKTRSTFWIAFPPLDPREEKYRSSIKRSSGELIYVLLLLLLFLVYMCSWFYSISQRIYSPPRPSSSSSSSSSISVEKMEQLFSPSCLADAPSPSPSFSCYLPRLYCVLVFYSINRVSVISFTLKT